jgi:hypothetical protein
MTHRFEVDYKERLEQSKQASNAVRLPRLGYKQYRIYKENDRPDKSAINSTYGAVSGSSSLKYSSLQITTLKYRSMQQSTYSRGVGKSIYWNIMDEFFVKVPEKYEVKWIKPKQATLLRLQGKRVEEQEQCFGTKHRRTKKK